MHFIHGSLQQLLFVQILLLIDIFIHFVYFYYYFISSWLLPNSLNTVHYYLFYCYIRDSFGLTFKNCVVHCCLDHWHSLSLYCLQYSSSNCRFNAKQHSIIGGWNILLCIKRQSCDKMKRGLQWQDYNLQNSNNNLTLRWMKRRVAQRAASILSSKRWMP